MLILQVLVLITLSLFLTALNLITIWYLAGIYLVLLGLILFTNDGDIFVGFLWVIDLGVGLVFFIFILHYGSFLHQKLIFNKNSRELSLTTLCLLFFSLTYLLLLYPVDNNFILNSQKSWLFLISWIDYYHIYAINPLTDLNLLHELYFVNSSTEFVFINFFLFYGIVSSILLSFLIKHVFLKTTLLFYRNMGFTRFVNSIFFIRNQDLVSQQLTSAGERVWVKKRFLNW